jgi:tight adherence protein B
VGGDASAAKTAKRTQAITERTRSDRPRTTAPSNRTAQQDPGQRRKQILKSLKEQDRQQKKAIQTLSSKMQQAGFGASLKPFWIASGVLGVVGLVAPLAMGINPLIGIGFGFVLGLGLPRWAVGFLAKRRRGKFSEAFPDAIDVITRGIKSGLPVHDCLKIIGAEAPQPLASEFERLVEGVGMGMTMDQALEKMYERMPTPELRFFTIVLAIQQKTGGNLAEALTNLSTVLRGRKMMREKVKALSGEALASAFIIGSLPPGVIILIGITTPAYMATLFTDRRGNLILLVASVMMVFGIWVMRRMMNFKI